MKMRLFSLRDTKAEVFGSPFVFAKVELAKRMVRDLCMDPKGMLARHPEDFHLYELGSFDDEKGDVRPESLVNHGSALSLMGPARNGLDEVQPVKIIS